MMLLLPATNTQQQRIKRSTINCTARINSCERAIKQTMQIFLRLLARMCVDFFLRTQCLLHVDVVRFERINHPIGFPPPASCLPARLPPTMQPICVAGIIGTTVLAKWNALCAVHHLCCSVRKERTDCAAISCTIAVYNKRVEQCDVQKETTTTATATTMAKHNAEPCNFCAMFHSAPSALSIRIMFPTHFASESDTMHMELCTYATVV